MWAAYKAATSTVTRAHINHLIAAVVEKRTFQPYYLAGLTYSIASTAAQSAILVQALSNMTGVPSAISACKFLRHVRGTFTCKDTLCFVDGGKNLYCGKARMFIEVVLESGDSDFFVWLDAFPSFIGECGVRLWKHRQGVHRIVPARELLRAVPHVQKDDDHIIIGFPAYVK